MTEQQIILVIVGMTFITALSRTLFFLSRRPMHMPEWVQRGLKYAPLAALTATVAPSLLLASSGTGFIDTLYDARIYAILAAIAWYVWQRGMFGTIIAGMTVYLLCHVGLGW